jgi:hypothetical protein
MFFPGIKAVSREGLVLHDCLAGGGITAGVVGRFGVPSFSENEFCAIHLRSSTLA